MQNRIQEVEFGSINKNTRSVGTALLVGALAIGFSAITMAMQPKVSLAQKCYEYTGADMPDEAKVKNIALYSAAQASLTCPLQTVTFCGFCIEDGEFPVDATGKPILWDVALNQATDLGKVVIENSGDFNNHDVLIEADNGNMVTLRFRKEK